MQRVQCALVVEPARDGGYVVREYDRVEGRTVPWGIIFAGSLDECLTYVAGHFDSTRRV